MQAIINFKINSKYNTNKVLQYPFILQDIPQVIKDNNIRSSSCVSAFAHKCERAVEQQRLLFRETINTLFPSDTKREKDNKIASLMWRYYASVYGEQSTLEETTQLYKYADGYTAFVSAFVHYHAHRLGGQHRKLKSLLLTNKISPVCQPLYLSSDYSKLYLLDDSFCSMSYERQNVTIIDITDCVFKLLVDMGIISDGEFSLPYWLWNIKLAGDKIPAQVLGEALAFALFEYQKNDCFVVRVV